MAMPKNKAVKVVRIAYDPKLATDEINNAIAEIEADGGTGVSIGYLMSDTVILTYAPEGADSSDGEDIPDEQPPADDDNDGT